MNMKKLTDSQVHQIRTAGLTDSIRAMFQKYMNLYCRRGGIRYSFHDIRALCATRQPTLEIAQQLLGHSNSAMTRRIYRRGKERVIPQRGLIQTQQAALT